MTTSVFANFHKHLTPVDKTNYQQSAPSKKKQKYTLPLTLAGVAAGIVQPSFKVRKNINMQYAIFAKEKLKSIMTKEFDQAHRHPGIPRFSKNPITHIKQIKDSIKNYDEDIFSYQESLPKFKNKIEFEKEIIDIKKKKITLQEFLVEYQYIFKDMNLQFRSKICETFVNKAISGILIWSTIGTFAGIALEKIKEKGSAAK